MKDLIERQKAIDAIIADKIEGITLNIMISLNDGKQAETFNNACDRHARLLNDLPSAQPEPQWIPVSERLPDMPIRVLVQLDNGWIITAYRQDNEWFSVPAFGEAIKDKWVEAWMPLPEPYRAERRTDE